MSIGTNVEYSILLQKKGILWQLPYVMQSLQDEVLDSLQTLPNDAFLCVILQFSCILYILKVLWS